ncbi:MAG: MBL fold metallo-hydrolase [Halodesulfurarchaeum sp.]
MELRFLGGAGEIGRSAVLVDETLLLDFGLMSGDPLQFPRDPPAVEAVIASHGHLDHVGTIPALMAGEEWPRIHWTPPTAALADRLARDTLKLHGVPETGAGQSPGQPRAYGGTYNCPFTGTHVARTTQQSRTHSYGEPFDVGGYEVTFYDAGHIPGSAHVLIDDGTTKLLYTGDFHTVDQRLVAGSTDRPAADVIITESTYADRTHEDRQSVERRFVRAIEQTIWEGGTVVVPAFAIGRTQEVLLICAAQDIPCYVDGMGAEITDRLLDHPTFLADAAALRRARGHARFVDAGDGTRRQIAEEPAAIVTTAGMLTGGPAMTYVPAVRSNPTNLIAFTGFQVPDTPGRELLETGSAEIDGRRMRISARIEQFDFSAHADREGLDRFLNEYAREKVVVVHGERTDQYATELRSTGIDAVAVKNGDRITID